MESVQSFHSQRLGTFLCLIPKTRCCCNCSTIWLLRSWDILEEAKNKEEDPFILILDGIEDPHNLGSIIRTAETAGVHGIIIPKRRNAAVNSTVVKVSAGATTYKWYY